MDSFVGVLIDIFSSVVATLLVFIARFGAYLF
jgi:hypothetical protein